MRTIDADELKKMFPDKGEGAWTYNITAKAYIDDAPTVDQWHYPSRGEYPTEGEEVWVAWTSEGSYDVVKFRHCMWGVRLSPPYAWQYIVPPREEV